MLELAYVQPPLRMEDVGRGRRAFAMVYAGAWDERLSD